MKIYSNSKFPRSRSELVSSAPSTRRERFDTLSYVAELEARNAKALQELSKKRPHDGSNKQRIWGRTGPPIKVPGGHVHSVYETDS